MKQKPTDSNPKSKVTRIKANQPKSQKETGASFLSPKNKTKTPKVATTKIKQTTTDNLKARPIRRLIRYVKAAFGELRLVIWPSRKDTWSMTLAVVLYAILISVVALLFDNLFEWLFKLIIK